MSSNNDANSTEIKSESDEILRETILISHANPEDNAFARWLAARLVTAGYRAWADIRSLRAGDDFWDVIEDTLRNQSIKQIVIVSAHIRKPGVMKELALGDYVGKQLNDPEFMIPIRVDPLPFGEFPPELFRRNAIDAYPSWAEVLGPLFETLEDAGVPRIQQPDGALLTEIVTAQEAGRKTIAKQPETLFSNWFPLTGKQPDVWVMEPSGTTGQVDAWSKASRAPHARFEGKVVTFCGTVEMAEIDGFPPPLKARACLPFKSVIEGRYSSAFPSVAEARKIMVNLMRQHWDWAMHTRGLRFVEFASGTKGWFFPDGLIDGAVKRLMPDGQRVSRVLSGKFKDRRWHLCLVAQPKLWPAPLFRIHANVAVTTDGVTPLPGEKLQKLRLRLTRSWWNDKWRDMLLAAMGWLGSDGELVTLGISTSPFGVASYPMTFDFPLSFSAEEERATEEDEQGNIKLSTEFDTGFDDDLSEGEAA